MFKIEKTGNCRIVSPIIAWVIIICLPACQSTSTNYRGLSEDLIAVKKDTVVSDSIIYHPVRVDASGNILPWYSSSLGQSYDYVLKKVWDFWSHMQTDSNQARYYMNHQVWRPGHDKRGIGGDQVMMALSSWDLYYNYTGDNSIVDNMKYMADYYLDHSLSPPACKWPNLPYPYNNNVEYGVYDGDMILGKDFLQPDKAGSFGYELVHLYKKTGEKRYLQAAINIANTMAENVQAGDSIHSPWPFKVNALTGKPGLIVDNEVWYEGMSKDIAAKNPNNKQSTYTSNWTPTLGLFSELIQMQQANAALYKKAYDAALDWLKTFPAKTNKWGPFFEDVPRWSDTQINAITYAMYIMQHREADNNWKATVKNIFAWVHKELNDSLYKNYGVIVTDEQTAYRQPGNSHSSRQASAELTYWALTGDTTFVTNAVRQLNWATYMVDADGKNFYPTNDIWMTDGYGDYTRHYLRAMAAAPELAPGNVNHLLQSSSIIKKIAYQQATISYEVFDNNSVETLRLVTRPKNITINGINIKEVNDESPGWKWQSLTDGGVLTINHAGSAVVISL